MTFSPCRRGAMPGLLIYLECGKYPIFLISGLGRRRLERMNDATP